ncbi:MAG: hypothetical protein IJ087_14795 [Eggerthellaceae bacterium]|nr:hypothetical protein [Eggerthellaceae bacterium]
MAAFSISEAMVGWLSSLGYRASTRVPGGASRFVTVERVGGAASSMVDHPQMAVQAWAPTEAEAEEMANDIRLAAVTQPPPGGVHSLRVSAGPYPFYDESTRCPRYQLVLDAACQLSV